MNEILYVFFEDIKVGELVRDRELIYSFKYSTDWLNSGKRFQLSLAMPFQEEAFGNKVTLSFFENLLPEGDVRATLEKNHDLESPFEFLKEFGKDCAGAVYLTEDESFNIATSESSDFEIDLPKIYEAIEHKQSVAEVISEMDPGYLSLAGAQDKFPANYRNGQFFLPINNAPTTHIIKVPISRSGVKESVFNEYYCMKLAKRVGLNVPNCYVLDGDGHPLFIIERYDRVVSKDQPVHRIHQQDFCQAQGVVSEKKYEAKGGPTLKHNYDLIVKNVGIKKRVSSTYSFLDWICFNLLIGNNDSHSKNISFLLKDNKIELAPYYDLLCTAIYPRLKKQFSFMIGDRDDASRIGKNQLDSLDSTLGVKEGTMCERMVLMKEKLMEHKDLVANEIKDEFSHVKIALRISELIEKRCKSLIKQGVK